MTATHPLSFRGIPTPAAGCPPHTLPLWLDLTSGFFMSLSKGCPGAGPAPLGTSSLPLYPHLPPSSLDPQKALEGDVLSLRKGCVSSGHSPVRLTGPIHGQAQSKHHKGLPSPLSRRFQGLGMGPSRRAVLKLCPLGIPPEMGPVPSAPATLERAAVKVLEVPSQVHGRTEATEFPIPGTQGRKEPDTGHLVQS